MALLLGNIWILDKLCPHGQGLRRYGVKELRSYGVQELWS